MISNGASTKRAIKNIVRCDNRISLLMILVIVPRRCSKKYVRLVNVNSAVGKKMIHPLLCCASQDFSITNNFLAIQGD